MNDQFGSSYRTYANSSMHLSGQSDLSRLSARVRDMVPVTYLRAPVGYGKSGLVDEWINERLACGFNVIYLDASELIEEILGKLEEPLATQQRVLASEDFSKSGQGPLAFAEERSWGSFSRT